MRKKPEPVVEERVAPKDAADKIRGLAAAKIAAENDLSDAIENVALGMGLEREKGKTQWSYDVPSGKFSRQSQASPST